MKLRLGSPQAPGGASQRGNHDIGSWLIFKGLFGITGLAITPKRVILLLRWLVVLATSYLVLFSGQFESSGFLNIPFSPAVAALVLVFILSNYLLEFVPETYFTSNRIVSLIIVFDSLYVTAALYFAPSIEGDIFFLYFFVILMAAVGGSFSGILTAAVSIPLLYVIVLLVTGGPSELMSTRVLLRLPFIFTVCIFYGYLAERGRHDRRRAEEAEVSESTKTRVFATLTHDVRNALGAIIGFSEVLLEEPEEELSPTTKELLQRIKMASIHSGQLIMNLLDAGRIENGQLKTPTARIDVGKIVGRVVQRYDAQAKLKHIVVGFDAEQLLPKIAGDGLQLDRVFSNLLSNALKFTPDEGQIEVSVREKDGGVEVQVADSGPGVPPEDRVRIFDAYGQTDSGQTAGGTGLGLYVVTTVLRAHGASVSVESAPSGGALFRVRFPGAPEVSESA